MTGCCALRGVACLLGVVACAAAQAQSTTIVPSFSAEETITSNRNLSSTDPQADAITRLSPGLRVSSRSGRVQGALVYSLSAVASARTLSQPELQNNLAADMRAELIENRAFLNASANISQQAISAFGTQSTDPNLPNENRTEVVTVNVSSNVRGNIGGFAAVDASAFWSGSDSAGTSLGDISSYGAQLALSGRAGLLGWGLNAGRSINDYKNVTSSSDQFSGSLSYSPRYDMVVSVRAGRTVSDALSGDRVGTTTSGYSVSWQPTERTDIGLQADRTYYGHSHSYSLRHRMARSVWSYIDSSGASGTRGAAGAAVAPLTLYDLFYSICLATGGTASACELQVRSELARQGLDPRAVVAPGSLNSGLTQSRTQALSVSVSALRSTFTLSGTRSAVRSLGRTAQTAPAEGDLTQVPVVRQQGLVFGASYQLTPGSGLTLSVTQQQTLDAGVRDGNRLRSVNLAWTMSPSAYTSTSLSARHTRFTNDTSPYAESAVTGSVSLRF